MLIRTKPRKLNTQMGMPKSIVRRIKYNKYVNTPYEVHGSILAYMEMRWRMMLGSRGKQGKGIETFMKMKMKDTMKKSLKNSYASLERIPRDQSKLCLIVELPYCQYKNNYKIFNGRASCMPYRRACLVSECALVKLHCIYKTCYMLYVLQ